MAVARAAACGRPPAEATHAPCCRAHASSFSRGGVAPMVTPLAMILSGALTSTRACGRGAAAPHPAGRVRWALSRLPPPRCVSTWHRPSPRAQIVHRSCRVRQRGHLHRIRRTAAAWQQQEEEVVEGAESWQSIAALGEAGSVWSWRDPRRLPMRSSHLPRAQRPTSSGRAPRHRIPATRELGCGFSAARRPHLAPGLGGGATLGMGVRVRAAAVPHSCGLFPLAGIASTAAASTGSATLRGHPAAVSKGGRGRAALWRRARPHAGRTASAMPDRRDAGARRLGGDPGATCVLASTSVRALEVPATPAAACACVRRPGMASRARPHIARGASAAPHATHRPAAASVRPGGRAATALHPPQADGTRSSRCRRPWTPSPSGSPASPPPSRPT
jgi:hypothetical protein